MALYFTKYFLHVGFSEDRSKIADDMIQFVIDHPVKEMIQHAICQLTPVTLAHPSRDPVV